MSIVIAILVFGILITVHELGHFLVAKALGVKVNEFAIGMGPAILKRQGKETLFSLRCVPIGGFCSMEGENEETEDPRAFSRQKAWKRFLILIAGSAMNFLIGFLIILVLYIGPGGFNSTTVDGFVSDYPEQILRSGDQIISMDGEKLYTSSDFYTFAERAEAGKADLLIRRDGKKLEIPDWPIAITEVEQNGEQIRTYALRFAVEPANVGATLKYTWYSSINFVRMVRLGLQDLIHGKAGVQDLQGPVGIVSMIGQVASESESFREAARNISYFCAFIAINLAVMNMLPIPALDGGRVFFLAVSWVIEKIRKKKLNPKYEGYVHAAGFVLLLGLMAYVMFNDVSRLIG